MSKAQKSKASRSSKKSGSKIDKEIALMRRKGGASLNEMIVATGWLPHTTHAGLSGLRKTGHLINRTKVEGVSRYAIEGVPV